MVEVKPVKGPNFDAVEGRFEVLQGGQVVETLRTQKRKYVSSAMPMTEAGIRSNFWRDLYVSMGDPLPGTPPQWAMRVYVKPFVPWLWWGGLLMTLAGVISALDRRYRKVPSSSSATTPVSAARSLA
mgnify:FL=1